MQIDVGELLKEVGRSVDIEDEVRRSYPEEGLVLKAPIKVKVHLVNTGRSVLLTGTLETQAEQECVRCLKKFVAPLRARMDEEFSRSPRQRAPHGGEIGLTEKDFVFSLQDEHLLDLEEVIRQNLILALGAKPLCRGNCPGLGEKKKKEGKTDPRLAKLKDFRL
jgi:uncharacterized protein